MLLLESSTVYPTHDSATLRVTGLVPMDLRFSLGTVRVWVTPTEARRLLAMQHPSERLTSAIDPEIGALALASTVPSR